MGLKPEDVLVRHVDQAFIHDRPVAPSTNKHEHSVLILELGLSISDTTWAHSGYPTMPLSLGSENLDTARGALILRKSDWLQVSSHVLEQLGLENRPFYVYVGDKWNVAGSVLGRIHDNGAQGLDEPRSDFLARTAPSPTPPPKNIRWPWDPK